MTIGSRIRQLREEAGLKQKDVAEALHITNRMLSNYERDVCEPSVEYIIAISRFFHVTSDYLLSLESEPRSSAASSGMTSEEQQLLRRYHSLNPENQECIRGMMIALDRQEHLSGLLSSDSIVLPK